MELPETIEYINEQLIREYGIASDNGKPMFRVVWGPDQFEKRLQSHVDGMQLLHPEVREVPKYRKAIRDYYVLERLVIVPIANQHELPSEAQSYEPLHHFWGIKDDQRVQLPPKYFVCKYIIDVMYAAMGKKGLAKYVDEEAKNPVEVREARIKELEEYLFGDESDLLGRTITGEAVGYTGEPKI